MKTATSFMPDAIAASRPWRFGTSAEYARPGLRTIRRDTSPPSASCGIHFGFTKLVISMARSPVSESASMSFTLSSVGTMRDSFCSPSRGPTSYIVTSGGSWSNTRANFTTRVTPPPFLPGGAPFEGPPTVYLLGPCHVETVARPRVVRPAQAADGVEAPHVEAPLHEQLVLDVPEEDLADDDGGAGAPDLDDAI